jgi:hypothetical protein
MGKRFCKNQHCMGHIVGSILAGPVDPTGLLQCKRSDQITRWNVADNTMYIHINIQTFRLSLLGFLRGICPFSFLFSFRIRGLCGSTEITSHQSMAALDMLPGGLSTTKHTLCSINRQLARISRAETRYQPTVNFQSKNICKLSIQHGHWCTVSYNIS